MQKEVNKFYNRLFCDSLGRLQYNIALETLVEKNFGEVNRYIYKLRPVTAKEGIDGLATKISKLCDTSARDGSFERYFFSGSWIAKFSLFYQVDSHFDGFEECSDFDEDTDILDEGVVKEINLEIISADFEIVGNIQDICLKSGYIFINDLNVSSGIPVTFAFPSNTGIRYRTNSFEGISLDSIKQNYASEVIEKANVLLKDIKKTTHGLVLIHGHQGCGKSYLIRSLVTELKNRRAVICVPPTQFLTQAGLLTDVVANFGKSFIILEDVGDVVSSEAATQYVDARANLLNMSEGFLSLLTDSIIVISFNYDIGKIDPAILRPGRCLSNIEIKPLSHEQAKMLTTIELPKRTYSLAEIYEINRTGKVGGVVATEKGLGFGR